MQRPATPMRRLAISSSAIATEVSDHRAGLCFRVAELQGCRVAGPSDNEFWPKTCVPLSCKVVMQQLFMAPYVPETSRPRKREMSDANSPLTNETEDGSTDEISEDLSDDCHLHTRKLLVVGAERLDETLESSLLSRGWEPIYAEGREDALRLDGEHRFLVGLLLLPQPFDEAQLRESRQLVGGFSHLEWIAALDRTQIVRNDVKRFIVDHMRDFQVFPLDPRRLSVVLGHACGLASIGESLRREQVRNDSIQFRLVDRKLLIVATDRLSQTVESALKSKGWQPIYAQGTDDAVRLGAEHRFTVALILLPQPFDDAWFLECRQLVGRLSQLEWVAALDRRHIARDDVKRFIVDQLRDFQVFPLDPQRLAVVLGHACGLASIGESLRQEELETESGRFGLIGRSPAMRELYFSIERVAQVDIPVLILGETGTGKELVARAIHAASGRASGHFVALNCAAIPTSLLQSELFGYEKGAFTGAFERKIGLIETAAGGTLLLDEIGEMPIQTQATLLRFLEDKNVTPIGGTSTLPVDVRVIASTNRDLEQGINDNAFREDLFYRLAVFTVHVPSLRDRGEDIDALARHFLQSAAKTLKKPVHDLTHDALSLLRHHNWPGNLRELRSWMFQAVLGCSGHRLTARDLARARPTAARPTSLSDAMDATEKKTLENTLSQNVGNVTKAAKALGVSRMTLYRLMEKHQIVRDRGGDAAG